MGSKGRFPPPPHMRHPLPVSGIMHPDAFGPGIRPSPPGPFPPMDMMPPPEVMEQKLAMQQVEMQRLATENQRLAATHGTLRQELAAAQHELQMLQAQIVAIKSEREQQKRGLLENISKMEADLKAVDSVKSELQQARKEAEKLVKERQELMAKIHQLTQDLNRAHVDVQQIPPLVAELEALRHEYQQCRVSYDYEKKLFSDHLESLQVMEKNYVTMATELEKLRVKLTNSANVDTRTGGPYGNVPGSSDREAPSHARQDAYGFPHSQGQAGIASGVGSIGTGPAANAVGSVATSSHVSAPPATAPSAPNVPGYQAPNMQGYEAYRGTGHDQVQQWYGYNPQRPPVYGGPGFDTQRVPGYDPSAVVGYNNQRAPEYYDPLRAANNTAPTAQHARVAMANNIQYGGGAATQAAHGGAAYEPQTVRK